MAPPAASAAPDYGSATGFLSTPGGVHSTLGGVSGTLGGAHSTHPTFYSSTAASVAGGGASGRPASSDLPATGAPGVVYTLQVPHPPFPPVLTGHVSSLLPY